MSHAENGNVSYPIEHTPEEKKSHIAIMLPGQDVRRIGMFDEISQHPAGLEVLERGNEIMKGEYGVDIVKLATPTGDPETDKENAATLRETSNTQPAVYLLGTGIHNVNRYLGKRGYATTPEYFSGNSMGMGIAATLAGFMDFETGLRFHAERGRIMQEKGDPQPTSMIGLLRMEEGQVLKLLGEVQNEPIDLCLINSNEFWVVGGPNENVEKLQAELKGRKQRFIPIDTDRSMHGRYVRPARDEFDQMLSKIKFKNPTSAVVGSLTGIPIRSEETMKEELKIGFDHTVDNRKPHIYFDAAGVHTYSEVGNPKGNFARMMESLGSVNMHTVAEIAALGAAVGVGVYEVITQHNRKHPRHNGEH